MHVQWTVCNVLSMQFVMYVCWTGNKKVRETTALSFIVVAYAGCYMRHLCIRVYKHCMSLDRPESKYKLYQFVCSAIFHECITQRWECKSAVNVKPIQADLSHSRMQTGETFSEVLRGEHHKKRCQERSTQCSDSWLTCRKIHKQAGAGLRCKQETPLTRGGHSVLWKPFLSIIDSFPAWWAELHSIQFGFPPFLLCRTGDLFAWSCDWSEEGRDRRRRKTGYIRIAANLHSFLYHLIK